MKSIYIYGASGHGLVVADMALSCGYDNVIFIDDGENEYPTFEQIQHNKNIPIALGVGDNKTRAKLYERVQKSGFLIVTLIHPSAIISLSATIAKGTVIMPNVVVNAKAVVGDGVILNTACVVEHECIIEDFVHVSPNVALAGNVKVGKLTLVGIGSSVIQGIIIGKDVVIGGGSTVIRDIKDNQKVVGTRAKEISIKTELGGGGK